MYYSLNVCWLCREQLSPDNYDGTCSAHDVWPPRDEHGRFRAYTEQEWAWLRRRQQGKAAVELFEAAFKV